MGAGNWIRDKKTGGLKLKKSKQQTRLEKEVIGILFGLLFGKKKKRHKK